MKTIFKTQFGSHLYGTNTPSSDVDIKGIFIPDYKDILLQRTPKTSINTSTKIDEHSKNTNLDVDIEIFTLHGFLKLAQEGQTVVLDMLFSPEKHWMESSFEWKYIVNNRNKLISKQSKSFIGYCFKQAAKYGLKGSRVNAAQIVQDFLSSLNPHSVLYEHENSIVNLIESFKGYNKDGSEIELLQIITDPKGFKFFEVNGRKLQFNDRVDRSLEVITRLVDNYGERAKMAASNQGIDWKALSHAIRVLDESSELLTTGHITFPLINAQHILDIKLGKLSYNEIEEEIQNKLKLLKEYEIQSKLPETIDKDFWDEFVMDVYTNKIIKECFSLK